MGRKDHGGSGAVGRPQVPMTRAVKKRRKRWPDSCSAPAAPETPVGQIRLKRKVTPRAAGHRGQEEGRYALKVSD